MKNTTLQPSNLAKMYQTMNETQELGWKYLGLTEAMNVFFPCYLIYIHM